VPPIEKKAPSRPVSRVL